MANYNGTVTFGTTDIHITTISDRQVPGTIKQVVGKTLIKHTIPGRGTQDWDLEMNGNITGSAYQRSTKRSSVQGLFDFQTHQYTDGIHNGTYIIDNGGLSWNTKAEDGGQLHRFTLRLIQYQQ